MKKPLLLVVSTLFFLGSCARQEQDKAPSAPEVVFAEKGKEEKFDRKARLDDKPRDIRPDPNQGVYATCAGFSPDNQFVLVGFGGGSERKEPKRTKLADALILYEVASGKEIRFFKGHPGGVNFVDFLPNGTQALSGGADGLARVWDIGTGTEDRNFSTGIIEGKLSANGQRLLGYHNRSLTIWDVAIGKRIHNFNMPKEIYYSAISPNGKIAFVSASELYLWDVENWCVIEEYPRKIVGPSISKSGQSFSRLEGKGWPAAFSPDGKNGVLCKYMGVKHQLEIWNFPTRKEVLEVGDKELWPMEVFLSQNGNVICQSFEGRLVCWGKDGKQIWAETSKELERLRFFVFSKDGKLGVSNNFGGLIIPGEREPILIQLPSSFSMHIWDLEKGFHLRSLDLPKLPERK